MFLLTSMLSLAIWVIGWLRFVAWHITRWLVPVDKLSRVLEYDSLILEAVPREWRQYYMRGQDSRRLKAEINELRDLDRKWSATYLDEQ